MFHRQLYSFFKHSEEENFEVDIQDTGRSIVINLLVHTANHTPPAHFTYKKWSHCQS